MLKIGGWTAVHPVFAGSVAGAVLCAYQASEVAGSGFSI
jgi:hypothetical protein